jgi:hypothetical protein
MQRMIFFPQPFWSFHALSQTKKLNSLPKGR